MRRKLHFFFFVYIVSFFLLSVSSCDITLFPEDGTPVPSQRVFSTETDSAEINVSVSLSTLKVVLKDNPVLNTVSAHIEEAEVEDVSYSWFVSGLRQAGEDENSFLFNPYASGLYQVDCFISGNLDGKRVSGVGTIVVERNKTFQDEALEERKEELPFGVFKVVEVSLSPVIADTEGENFGCAGSDFEYSGLDGGIYELCDSSDAKGLFVSYEKTDLQYMYKAEPLFDTDRASLVPGFTNGYLYLDSAVALACGVWRITVVAIKDNKIVYQGIKDVSITLAVAKNKIEIEIGRDSVGGWGMLTICFTETYDEIVLNCKNVKTCEEKTFSFQISAGNSMGIEMEVGTYVLTFIKNYTETDGGLYNAQKSTGITLLATIDNGYETFVRGDIENFRECGEVFITLPTIMDGASYSAYDYFTYEELKTYGYSGSVFIGEYLDDVRMEDALYYVPEDWNAESHLPQSDDSMNLETGSGTEADFSLPVSCLGKARGQHLYAHRKKYALNWNLPAQSDFTVDKTGCADDGSYYWNTYLKAPVLTKEGYNLTGWSPSFTGRMPAENVSYSPVLVPLAYTLTLNYNLPALAPEYESADLKKIEALPQSLQVTFDMNYEGLPSPTLTEYVFKGWELQDGSGKMISSSSIVETAEDHTAKAVWDKKSYVVSFNLNLPSDAAGTKPADPANKTIYYGDNFSFPFTEYDFDNYVFDGWYTKASGGTPILASTVAKPSSAGVSYFLHAHWKPVYKISLNVSSLYLGTDKSFYCNELKITDVTNNQVYNVANPLSVFEMRLPRNVKYSVQGSFKSKDGLRNSVLMRNNQTLSGETSFTLDPLEPNAITASSEDSVQDAMEKRLCKFDDSGNVNKYKSYSSYSRNVTLENGSGFDVSSINSGKVYLTELGTKTAEITAKYGFTNSGFTYAITSVVKNNVTLSQLEAPYVSVQRKYTKNGVFSNDHFWVKIWYRTTVKGVTVYITERCRTGYNDYTNKPYTGLSVDREYSVEHDMGTPGHYYIAFITGYQCKNGYKRSITAYYENSVGLSNSEYGPSTVVWSNSPYSQTEPHYDLEANFRQTY